MKSTEKPYVRKTLSCQPCRRRKVKCDYGHPCAQCRIRGSPEICLYGAHNKWGYVDGNYQPDQRVERSDREPKRDSQTLLRFGTNLKNASLGAFIVDRDRITSVVPERSQADALIAAYRDLVHHFIPVLDWKLIVQNYFHLLSGDLNNVSDDQLCSLTLILTFGAKISKTTISLQAYEKLLFETELLISQLKFLPILSLDQFCSVLIYAWMVREETTFYTSRSLFAILSSFSQRLFSETSEFTIKEDPLRCQLVLSIFQTLELQMANSTGSVSFLQNSLMPINWQLLDPFHTARLELLQLMDVIRDKVYSVKHLLHPAVMVDYEARSREVSEKFKNGTKTWQWTPYQVMQRYIIQTMCNQVNFYLYRPLILANHILSQDDIGRELFRRKGHAAAVAMIETQLLTLNDPQVSAFSWCIGPEILLPVFHALIILSLDHNFKIPAQSKLRIETFRRFSISLMTRENEISTRIWTNANHEWRSDLINQCKDQLFALKSGNLSTSSRAILILSAVLNNVEVFRTPGLFGPFVSKVAAPLRTDDETRDNTSLNPLGLREGSFSWAKVDRSYYSGVVERTEFEKRVCSSVHEIIHRNSP